MIKRRRSIRFLKNLGRKPVEQISDRAKRYRAQHPDVRPLPPKQCGFCGSKRSVIPHHILGDESDGSADNLMWACKSCNGKVGHKMRKNGIGKLTRQYNPPRARGGRREQMKAYGDAIKVMRGDFDGDVGRAVATIRSTPRDIRSAFTARSWPVRKQKYGPSGRQMRLGFSDVPF
jgi:hypothetical protein